VSEFEKVSYLIPIINIIYWVGEGDYCNEFSGQKTCNTNAYYVNLLINVNYGEGEEINFSAKNVQHQCIVILIRH